MRSHSCRRKSFPFRHSRREDADVRVGRDVFARYDAFFTGVLIKNRSDTVSESRFSIFSVADQILGMQRRTITIRNARRSCVYPPFAGFVFVIFDDGASFPDLFYVSFDSSDSKVFYSDTLKAFHYPHGVGFFSLGVYVATDIIIHVFVIKMIIKVVYVHAVHAGATIKPDKFTVVFVDISPTRQKYIIIRAAEAFITFQRVTSYKVVNVVAIRISCDGADIVFLKFYIKSRKQRRDRRDIAFYRPLSQRGIGYRSEIPEKGCAGRRQSDIQTQLFERRGELIFFFGFSF